MTQIKWTPVKGQLDATKNFILAIWRGHSRFSVEKKSSVLRLRLTRSEEGRGRASAARYWLTSYNNGEYIQERYVGMSTRSIGLLKSTLSKARSAL